MERLDTLGDREDGVSAAQLDAFRAKRNRPTGLLIREDAGAAGLRPGQRADGEAAVVERLDADRTARAAAGHRQVDEAVELRQLQLELLAIGFGPNPSMRSMVRPALRRVRATSSVVEI